MNPGSGKNMSHAVVNYLGLGVVPAAAQGTNSERRVLPVASQEPFSDLWASGEMTACSHSGQGFDQGHGLSLLILKGLIHQGTPRSLSTLTCCKISHSEFQERRVVVWAAPSHFMLMCGCHSLQYSKAVASKQMQVSTAS